MTVLRLDYQRRPQSVSWSGVALLALALTAVGLTGVYYAKLNDKAAKLEASNDMMEQSSRSRAQGGRFDERETREMALEIRHANEVLRQLSLPWESLFQAVESSGGKEVSLLGLEPNTEKRQVKISGEAKNIAAMLDYIDRLETREVFGTVYLLNHQIQQQDPEKPVRFAVIAVWKEKS